MKVFSEHLQLLHLVLKYVLMQSFDHYVVYALLLIDQMTGLIN